METKRTLFFAAAAWLAACGPPPKWKEGVAPLFHNSCAFSSCHGTTTPQNGLTLDGTDDASRKAVRDALINKVACQPTASMPCSRKDTSLLLVVPGDPAKSFLIHKLNGDFKDLSCLSIPVTKCGAQMPNTGLPLSGGEIGLVTEWVRLGALDD
jgi:hypothetical protein